MSFFAILFALLIEQVRPLPRHSLVHGLLRSWVRWASRNFDAGKPQHGWIAWGLAVLLPTLAVWGVYWLLALWVGWPVAVLFSVGVLYLTLGFRQFSHHFTNIRDALEAGDETTARQLLARWQRVDASQLPKSEIVRHVVEYSVLEAHRHVFGVLLWFSVLAAFGFGPAGAMFFRLSEFVARYWHGDIKLPESQVTPLDSQAPDHPAADDGLVSPAVQQAAQAAWRVVDWLPARTTAVAFAVVGSFEEAIDCWRNYAARFPNDNDGVILAATSGAVNVRLGGQALRAAFSPNSSQGFQVDASLPGLGSAAQTASQADSQAAGGGPSTPGREPEVAHLRSIVGLVWRSVVLWMVLLALLTLARLLG
ncbi:MAG: cobalamin biosynthesis protein [Burkholderiaceae bacterium]